MKRLPLMKQLLLLALVVFPTLKASADPEPRNFYERNFAEAPEVAQKPLAGEVITGERPVPNGSNAGSAAQSEESGGRSDTGSAPGATTGKDRTKRRSAIPSTTLSLYVNSKDKEHLQRVLEKARDVAKREYLYFTTVYHVGDYRNVPPELQKKLAEVGVQMHPLGQVPPIFPVSQSPAWIFHSKEGYQIVEGTLDIEQFFDTAGKFREPKNFVDTSNVQATPVPDKLADF